MIASHRPERGGWDEDKCRNFIARTLEWVPRNYGYQDGLRFIHRELEIAFGDENGDLATGVLEELIELDGLPPWPESIFQRWKFAYRHRHEQLHLPHTPSTRTILRPVVATEKTRLSLPSANDRQGDTATSNPAPILTSLSTTAQEPALGISRSDITSVEEYPAFFGTTTTPRNESSWAIEHTVYISKKGARPSIFSAFTREDFEKKSRDPRFGTGGRIMGMKFVDPPPTDKQVLDEKGKLSVAPRNDVDPSPGTTLVTPHHPTGKHLQFICTFWKALRRHIQNWAHSNALAFDKKDEEFNELESELNFKKISKNMFQAENTKRFDFQRHLREMHWPSDVEVPNANFARKYHLVPRGEALPVEILNARQHTVTEDLEGTFKGFWAHARFEIEDLQIEGESLSGTLRQKLFFRYVEDYQGPLPLDPSLFLDTGLDFNWSRNYDGWSVKTEGQMSNETLSGSSQGKSSTEDLRTAARGPGSSDHLSVGLAISLQSWGHNSSVSSVDDWLSAQSQPVNEVSQREVFGTQEKKDPLGSTEEPQLLAKEEDDDFILPRSTFVPSSPIIKTTKTTKMAKTNVKSRQGSGRKDLVFPYSPALSSSSLKSSKASFGEAKDQPSTKVKVPEIKCHSPSSSAGSAMSGLACLANQEQVSRSSFYGGSTELRSSFMNSFRRNRESGIGALRTSTSLQTGRLALKLESTARVTQSTPNITRRTFIPSLAINPNRVLKGSTRRNSNPSAFTGMGYMSSRPTAGTVAPRESNDATPPGLPTEAPRSIVISGSSGLVQDRGSRLVASVVRPPDFDEMYDATPPTSPRRSPGNIEAATSSAMIQSSHLGPVDTLVPSSNGLDDAIPPESQPLAPQGMAVATGDELVRSDSVKSMARPLSPKEFDETYDRLHVGGPSHIVPPRDGPVEDQSLVSLDNPTKNSDDIFDVVASRQDSTDASGAPSQHLQTSERVTSIGAETRQRDSPELSRVYRWQNRHQQNIGNFDGASDEICLPTLDPKDNPNVHNTTVHVNGYEITTVCWNVPKNNPKMASEHQNSALFYDSPSPPPLRIYKQPGQVRVAQSQQQLGENAYKDNSTFPPRTSSMRTSDLVDDGFGRPIAETFNYVDRDRGHTRKRSNATSGAASTQSSRAINSLTNSSTGRSVPVNSAGSALSAHSGQHLSGSSGIIGNFVPFESPTMNASAPAPSANSNRGNLDALGKIKKDVNPYQFEPDTPLPARHHTHMTTFTDFISDPHESQLAQSPEAFFLKKSPSTGNSMSNGHQFTPMKAAATKSDKRGMPRSESSPAVSHPARFQAQYQRGPDIASRYGEIVDRPIIYTGQIIDPFLPTERGRSPPPQGRRGRSYEEDGTPKAFTHPVNLDEFRFPERPRRAPASNQHIPDWMSTVLPEHPLASPLRAPSIEQNGFSSSMSSRYRPASPTKTLVNVVERDEVEVDILKTPGSPKKRSRSPMKKMFGENGWLGRSPLEAQGTTRQVEKVSTNPKEKKGLMDKLRAKMVDIAEKADLSPIGRSRNSADNPAKISFLPTSLAPPHQARVLAEVELILVHTANSFLMNQFSQGRVDVDSIKKTIDGWKAKGRPTVIEFMYDQATQRDLIAINQQNLRFYGDRAIDNVRINATLYTWKLVASHMAVRTFCEADTVLLKLFFDIEQVLELLGCVDSLMLRFQEVRAIANERIRQQKKHNSEAQSVRNGQERTWHAQSSRGSGEAAGRSVRQSFDDPYGGLKLVPDHYKEQHG